MRVFSGCAENLKTMIKLLQVAAFADHSNHHINIRAKRRRNLNCNNFTIHFFFSG